MRGTEPEGREKVPDPFYFIMRPISDILTERVTEALADIVGLGDLACPAGIKPTQNPDFGDYQANGAMAMAKRLKRNPREQAQQIVDNLDVSDICETPEIAGPGFINFKLKPQWLAQRITEAVADRKRLGVEPAQNPQTVVVDFSGPNLAKQMHVGHLRSTIIGDVIARLLEFHTDDPDKIIRQNHVGDWGLQFGMLITYLRQWNPEAVTNPQGIHIADLEEFYRDAKKRFDNDEKFKQESYQATVALHKHDPETIDAWNYVVAESRRCCQEVYQQLDVILDASHERGESTYSHQLPAVVADLDKAQMLTESDGAQCVFLDKFKNKQGDPLPLIVQKTDGAFLYATTDLAALRYRVAALHADRVIYVTDARQKLHFDMVFTCARAANWASESVKLEHVPFGSVLGDDGKPFKTRSGENIKLKALLDEAEQRARKIVDQKNPDLDDDTKSQIAHAVGIGAVKYADLSNNLVSDYVFDWDKMLAMEGNTAPYMQYAYARIQSIFRKGGVDADQILAQDNPVEPTHLVELTHPGELALAKMLLRYGETIEAVAADLRPHILTTYLFELAQSFSTFYNACPVLKAPPNTRSTRLLLCYLTARTIKHGLYLLGIKTIDKM